MPSVKVLVSCVSALLVLSYFFAASDGLAVMSVDLGSQFMKIAIVKPGIPMEIALNKESRRKTPMAVSLRNKERLFSDGALAVSVMHPDKSYIYLHDLLGKKLDNPHVKNYQQRFPWYKLEEDKTTGNVVFRHDSDVTFTPEELMGMILNHSRFIGEQFADHPIKDVVLTVPPFFNQAERRALLRAAELVGLNVLQIMNSNTAVALNYGLFQQKSFNDTLEKHFMFYDMGASSTVATIVGYSMTKTKDRGISETAPQLVIKGIGFDRTLGGHAIDMRLRDHLVQLFKKNYKFKGEVTQSSRAMAKFYKEALRVKQVLSANNEIFAQIEGVFDGKDFRVKVTREELEEMCQDLFDRVAGPVNRALKSASMTMNDIDSVVLVGGGIRVPKVQDALLRAVKKPELAKNINADEAAALGAVYQAAHLGKGFKVKKFIIKDANIYPIQVSFSRKVKAEDGTESTKHVKRTLYYNMNTVPQKKVMTFNKHTDDFQFHVSYNGLEDLMNPADLAMFGELNVSTVSVKGVADALNKHASKGESKGIKAYFRLDENGLFNIDKVESVFEKMPEDIEDENESTLSKLGSKITSFFSGSNEKSDDAKEGSKDAKPDEPKDEKSDDVNEKPKDEEAEKEEDKKEEKKEEEKKPDEKKEDESKSEGKKEGDESKSEGKKEEPTADKDKKAEKADGKEAPKDANTTEEAPKKKAPSKPVTVRETLTMTVDLEDAVHPSHEDVEKSRAKLVELQARDDAKAANERAKNALESHIFGVRDEMNSELGEKLSTEAERETISEALTAASDWLDEDGWDSTANVYNEKLNGLKKISADFRRRMKEHKTRPKALAALNQSLNLSSTFLKQVKNMMEKDEIYTGKDLEELDKVNNETKEWLEKMTKKQDETKPHEAPVLLTRDIEHKQNKIDRELLYLLNKAKYYVPKPKPKVNDTGKPY
ncbi:predicted protein [Nematostella vectensis]|uniref:Hypoxia up-regulated protein 1 n=1 Tax=Nematostella vectensis TaxID=45351 RepID=A7SM46_NEMVE|nr:predicted protein [Nematostella vectensis]|eukprot:XP_001627304.1 predicted protein [Nematostella vectensis]